MKIEGVKRLLRQLDNLPETTQLALVKSIDRTVKLGVTKAKAVAPVDEGDFKRGINGNTLQKPDRITGFINFYDGTAGEGLAANAINYGWTRAGAGTGSPADTRKHTMMLIGDRHKRAVSRQIKKAIKEALNG